MICHVNPLVLSLNITAEFKEVFEDHCFSLCKEYKENEMYLRDSRVNTGVFLYRHKDQLTKLAIVSV
jgi:hypothetical protein